MSATAARFDNAEVTVELWPRPRGGVVTRRQALCERHFGVDVADPYRWLEDGASPEVAHWVELQNAQTEAYLSRFAGRAQLRQRMTELLGIGSVSLPSVRRSARGALRLFYTRREGKDEQAILYVRDGLDGAERALVDPTRSGGSSITLDWYEPSRDGSLLAYGLSRSGSEDSVLYVLRVDDGSHLPDSIDRARFATVAWRPDTKAFFYPRYPAPSTVPSGEERLHRRIYEHRLGDDPAHDRLVFGAELASTDSPNCALSPNGRWLVINLHRSWSESALLLSDARSNRERWLTLADKPGTRYSAVVRDDRLFVLSNEDAPRYQLFSVDPLKPERKHWRLIVPEHSEDVLTGVEAVGAELLASYLHAGASRLARFSLDGKPRGGVDLPTLGASDGFTGLSDGSDAFYDFESFALPRQIMHLDLKSGRVRAFQSVKSDIDSANYVVEQRQARSRDGTEIPYQLVRRRDVGLTSGRAPTLLYGYGGFNISLEPRFSRPVQALLERGGVFVQALLRGGGEFGEAWHRAGQLGRKQNSFDDFVAVAEALLRTGVTNSERLAISGRSNGGLLVAAALTQRPELFRAAVAGVPLTDMLRYPQFLLGKLWVSEYGSPEKEADFRALLAYSPYHRLRLGVRYPATLVTTADTDTRVDPLHARKFAAALQQATGSERPVLLRVERSAGHGAGTPLSKQIDELTDVYSFLFAELGL
ncbi:MAG: prolyl oligopeptidase family serine peptidase [Polyangiaceae bacterium]